MTNVDAEFSYKIDHPQSDESFGKLPHREPQVTIRRYRNLSSFEIAMSSSLSITHQSMLRSFHGHKSVQDIDEHKNVQDIDEYYVVYEDYSKSLRAHVNKLKNQHRFGLRQVYYYGNQLCVPKEIQKIIKCLLEFIKYLHDLKFAMGSFTINNIVMVEQLPKLVDVKLVQRTEATLESDYVSLKRLIEQIYVGNEMPSELNDFTHALGTWYTNENFVHNHCCLWESEERLTFMRNVWDRWPFLSRIDRQRHYQAVKRIHLQWYVDNKCIWNTKIPRHGPLRNVYNFCYYGNTLEELVRFVRNVVTHIGNHSNGGQLINHTQVDGLISSAFPGLMVKLQKCLCLEGFAHEDFMRS